MCSSEDKEPDGRRPHRYLPHLTGTLLALLLAWFLIWFVFQRPVTPAEKRLAALRQALRYVPAYYIHDVDEEQLYHAAMKGMMESLRDKYADKYSRYVTPTENRRIRQATAGEFGGIGVVVATTGAGTVVAELIPGDPAERAGMAVGDVIISVAGEDVSGLSTRELAERIRGKVGTRVVVGVRRPQTEEDLAFSLTRASISAHNVEWKMRDDGIGYLQLRAFDEDCAAGVKDALGQMQGGGLKGIILDLRDNPGGLMDQALEAADLFLDKGLIVTVKSRVGAEVHSAGPEVAIPVDVPVVVLVNARSASAAEILAGALQANGRARLVGTRTKGKGCVTRLLTLNDGSALNLTVERYYLAGGEAVEGLGLGPDVVVGGDQATAQGEGAAAEQAPEKQLREAQLQRAVELVREQIAGQ